MFEYLLAQLCLGFSLKFINYSSACNPTLEAVSIQSKVKPLFDNTQHILEEKVKNQTGENIWFVAGTYYAFNQSHLIKFSTNIKSIADSLDWESDSQFSKETVSLSWHF